MENSVQSKKSVSSDFAWAVYNFINEYKAGKYGVITLQQALDLYFDY